MATISEIINKIACGGVGSRGTGTAFCDVDMKTPVVFGLTNKNLKLSGTTTMNAFLFTTLIQQEKMIIVKGVVSFTPTTAGNEYQTYESTGIKKLTKKNPYEAEVTLDKGINHFKAIEALESHSVYDLWIWDEKNDLFCALNDDGSIRGLDALMFSVEDYKAGNQASYMFRFQIDRTDFDKNITVTKSENLAFDAKRVLDGYNDIDIKVTTPSAGTTFNFQTWATNNNKRFGLFGLQSTEIKIEKATFNSGVVTGWVNAPFTMLPTSLGADPDYIVTMGTAMTTGDKYRIKTFDSTLQSNVILVEGVFYKSYNPANDNYFEFVVL
jgi:hypothetical protein